MRTPLYAAVITLALTLPAAADRADDDLAAVKKAVAAAPSQASAPATARAVAEEEPPAVRRHGGEPKWFRVKVVEKGGKGAKVSLSLPLGLVRSFGDEWPLHVCHHGPEGRCPTVGAVLRSLDSGQSLVEIDDEEATVRIWVE